MGANAGGAIGGTVGVTTDGASQLDKRRGVNAIIYAVNATIHAAPVALLSPLPPNIATVFCAPRQGSLGNSPRRNVPLSIPAGSMFRGSAHVTCYRSSAD